MGNTAIKDAISRDDCCLLSSKLYSKDPEKLPDASKIYYVDNFLSCFKNTFREMRSNSEVQRIDESKTKFKDHHSNNICH